MAETMRTAGLLFNVIHLTSGDISALAREFRAILKLRIFTLAEFAASTTQNTHTLLNPHVVHLPSQ